MKQNHNVSLRRACRVVGISDSVYRYQPDAHRDDGVIDALQKAVKRWYEQEDLPLQSYFVGMSHWYSGLGDALFLSQQPMMDVCHAFSLSGKSMLQSFTMAYDPNDFYYVCDKPKREDQIDAGYGQVDWASVMETDAIDGLNWALMGKV